MYIRTRTAVGAVAVGAVAVGAAERVVVQASSTPDPANQPTCTKRKPSGFMEKLLAGRSHWVEDCVYPDGRKETRKVRDWTIPERRKKQEQMKATYEAERAAARGGLTPEGQFPTPDTAGFGGLFSGKMLLIGGAALAVYFLFIRKKGVATTQRKR